MRYRYSNDRSPLLLILLLLVIVGIIFGTKYKKEITLIFDDIKSKISNVETNTISLDSAEEFFYNNKPTFEEFVNRNDKTNIHINDMYISIIDRFDFGGNRIRAFRFQTEGDIGTEIIYSENELQQSSILKLIEKHWYVYNYVAD